MNPLRRLLRWLWVGLMETGWAMCAWDPWTMAYFRQAFRDQERERQERPRKSRPLTDPPPGHPERLVTDAPVGAEALLWHDIREDQ